MSGSRYLLDTNVVVAYFNQEASIREKLLGIDLIVPNIVIGELFLGAYNSRDVSDNLKKLRDFIAINKVLNCDTTTGDFYGQIKLDLRRKGCPIPENDIWIAAIARQYGLTLVTRDGHFNEVSGLNVVKW